MKIYMLFISCKKMEDILGVYSSIEKAEEELRKLSSHLTGNSCLNLFIVEREVL